MVGWREWVSLPDLAVARIKAKLDTGARTSALHAEDIQIISGGHRKRVRFTIHPEQKTRRGAVRTEAQFLGFRRIKSSTGHEEERPIITTVLRLGTHEYLIEMSLARRDIMGFRLLLGRQAIRQHFLINPGRSFLTGNRPPKKKKSPTKTL